MIEQPRLKHNEQSDRKRQASLSPAVYSRQRMVLLCLAVVLLSLGSEGHGEPSWDPYRPHGTPLWTAPRQRPHSCPMMLMALARASGYAPVKVVACGGFGCQRTVLIQHEAVEATELAASTIR